MKKYKLLSKTDLMDYYFCKKNLWLIKNKNFSKKDLSPGEKFRIEQGYKFEKEARKLFKDGKLVEGRNILEKITNTKLLMEKENIIFQPVIEYDGYIVISDVIIRNNDSWELYEMKSNTEIKRDNLKIKNKTNHIKDLAYQYNVLDKADIKISKIFVVHPDKEVEYVIDDHDFFKIEDVTKEVITEKDIVWNDMVEMKDFLAKKNVESGCECIYQGRSNHCNTFSFSNPEISDYSIHDLNNVGSSPDRLRELVLNKTFDISKLSENDKIISKSRRNQYQSFIEQNAIYERENINQELSKLKEPFQSLDFESHQSSIPIVEGFYSGEKIPFQWSLDILKENGELESHDFIATSISEDTIIDLSEKLFDKLDPNGSIIVWNKSFETQMFQNISRRAPAFKYQAKTSIENLFDLWDIFRKGFYTDYRTKGSSLKNVAPIVLGDLTYSKLEINDGEKAFIEWEKMIFSDLSHLEKERIKKNLIDYCSQDSIVTYKILSFLQNLSTKELVL